MKKIDENYFKLPDGGELGQTIESVLVEGESILWQGKPKKKAFIVNSVVKMLPLALLWLCFDVGFIVALALVGPELPSYVIAIMAIFFVIHLAPVWIWIAQLVSANRRYKNIEYAFTDRRIIVKTGLIGIDFKNMYYADVVSVNVKVGIVDKMLKVGDIYVKAKTESAVLLDLENPYFLTQKLQKITLDIKTDMAYPNALRPQVNEGYQTVYGNLDEGENN